MHHSCFNALSGLSCYVQAPKFSATWAMFQCPHGLELLRLQYGQISEFSSFQCPHGLIPHFYAQKLSIDFFPFCVSMPSWAYTSFLRKKTMRSEFVMKPCQCPLGLIPHFYGTPSKT